MQNDCYDVVIIGGGIHGAGVAQAAAVQGYSVLLLEQTGIASGTSSRSSKLIHGGLRYLETGQISLVRECLQERQLLLKMAPELVRRVPFYIPIYKQSTRRPWEIRAGLSLYALLGGLRSEVRFQSLPKQQWDKLDGLKHKDLQKVFQYYDAQTDDAALTRAVLKSAIDHGAQLSMPATFCHAKLGEEFSEVVFSLNEKQKICRARVIVNASGPWVNRTLENVSPKVRPISIELVQGTHILLPGELSQGIYYVESPHDRRPIFVMPWHGQTMVGTTESLYQGDPSEVVPLATEKEYLLTTYAHYFSRGQQFTSSQITASFAGLRVLPASKGNPNQRSRDTIYHRDRKNKPRILSIYGGKLTAYRHTAKDVMQRISNVLPEPKYKRGTATISLAPIDKIEV